MKPSKYQQAFYSELITTRNNIALESTAGSGKTTSLVEAAKLVPLTKKSIFLAFNKRVVKELREKLPKNIDCSTMHSLGCRMIQGHFPGDVSINEKKQIRFIEPLLREGEENQRKRWGKIYQVDHIMRLARSRMTDNIEELCDQYAIDADQNLMSVVKRAKRAYHAFSDDDTKYGMDIDFLDMIELCVRNKEILMPQYDYIFVDEGQDLSDLDHLFISRLRKRNGGRIIFCGDPRQSCYSFRGADPYSFQKFQNQPHTTTLPLSICYRCDKAIVREAQAIYPQILPFERKEEGEVRKGEIKEIEEGDMVICRNTRPLVSVYLDLIMDGKKAHIVGKDMEKGLLSILSQFESESTTEGTMSQLEGLLTNLGKELTTKNIVNVKKHPRYCTLQEKVEILMLIFSKFSYIWEVEEFISDMFEDESREGVNLLTIHKAKGAECDTVFWIETFEGKNLIPSQYAVTKEMLIQEKNLKFIAITRAKHRLIKLEL